MVDDRECRQVMSGKLVELAKEDNRICVLEADLMSCHATKAFKEAYPNRFINVGIAEQNLVGVASGLSEAGKVPFVYSFGPFATRRCFDQIFVSVAYAKLNVKIVGSDPGICAEANGGTHMPFEDMAIMRTIPSMVCFEPADAVMLEKAIPKIIKHYGPVYIRLGRKKFEKIYDDDYKFELGKAVELKDGKDVTLIASGIMVEKALAAAAKLAEEGISAKVINIHTWKPIDEEAIIAAAKKTGAIVTCENHNVIGGLGSAVAEVVVKNAPCKMKMVGVQDRFGQVGKLAGLAEEYGLTADEIYKAAKEVIAK